MEDEDFDREEENDLVANLPSDQVQKSMGQSNSRRRGTADSGTGSSSNKKRLSTLSNKTSVQGADQPELIVLDKEEDIGNIQMTLRDPTINKWNVIDSLYDRTYK